MIDLEPLKAISIYDVLDTLGVHVPTNVMSRAHPQIRCPLPGHDERSGSFTIYPENSSFYCFGCGRGGDNIDLVRQMTGKSLHDAATYIAAIVDMEIGTQILQREQTPDDLFPLVADQAYWEVLALTRKRAASVGLIEGVFVEYDEVMRQHRNREIDSQEGIKRILAWRQHWKARL